MTNAADVARAKPNDTALCACAIARRIVEAIDGDDAADRLGAPQRGLRSADNLDPRGKIGVEDLVAGCVARGRIVDLDSVDEQQGVIGLGAADADLGEGPERTGGRDGGRGSQPDQGGDERLVEPLDALRVDNSDACRRLCFGVSGAREAVMTIWSVSMGSAGM